MKTVIYSLLLIVSISLTSCEKETSNSLTLSATWHMQNVSGGLMGIDLDYNKGDVSWTFNESTQKVEVVNNILTAGPKSIYARFQTGTYNFNIITNNSNQELYIGTESVGILNYNTQTLTLDDGVAADGFYTVFER